MRILVVGAGPAGLSFALALKELAPENSIVIWDRSDPRKSTGWGITMPSATLDLIGVPVPYHRLDTFYLRYDQRLVIPTAINCVALSRQKLVGALRERCLAADVSINLVANKKRITEADVADFGLVVGADGGSSEVRTNFAEDFGPSTSESSLWHLWLATPKLFGSQLARMFRDYRGALFGAAAYQHSEIASTFVVECTLEGWQRAGLHDCSVDVACKFLAGVFSAELDGQPVHAQAGLGWTRFLRVSARRWWFQNIVLIGDAAHTTHYSKGHGTTAAIQDGVCLARHLAGSHRLDVALTAFEQERRPQVVAAQAKADSSQQWYERFLSDYDHDPGSAALALAAIERARVERLSRR